MTKLWPILVFAWSAFSVAAFAQSNQNAAAAWQAKMKVSKDGTVPPSRLQEALKVAEGFGETDPRLFETLIRLAESCYYDDDCRDKSAGYLDRALRMRARVKPADAHFADLLMSLGSAASGAGRYRDSVLVYSDALQIREKLFGPTDQAVAETFTATAWVYHWMKDPVQARRTMQHALEIRETAGRGETPEFAELLDQSASLYATEQHSANAEREYGRAIAIRERLWRISDPRFIKALKNIADRNQWGSAQDLSEKLYRRIAEIQKAAHSERSEAYCDALIDLGKLLRSRKKLVEAESVFQRAFELRVSMGKHDLTTANCLEQIAYCRMDRGLYKEAAEAGETSLNLRASLEKPSDQNTLMLDAWLAEAYLEAHNEPKSEAYLRTLSERSQPDFRWLLIQTAEKLSALYLKRGNYPRAAEKLELSVAVMEAANPADQRLPDREIRLSRLYQTMGRVDDANRMSLAAMRAVGNNIKQDANNRRLRTILLILGIAIVVSPLFGSAIFALLFARFARQTERTVAALYRVANAQDEEEHRTQSCPDGITLHSGFLGLTTVPETEGNVSHQAAPTAAPAMARTMDRIADASPAARPETGPVAEPPAWQVTLRADGSTLFAMRVLNLLLSLLTLGVYSFWGKAKVRRYVCGQAEFQGDWFAFHGTGRELMFGWLRAFPLLAFIFLFPNILPLLWHHKFSVSVAQLSAIAAVGVLWPVARVGAYRYRLNRMSWRAIRFSYRGSAFRYLITSVSGWLVTVVTLGIYGPFLQVRLRKLLFEETYLGDSVFRFQGRASALLPAWLFALPLSFCSFGIGWAWWRALSHRYCWAHTTVAGGRFRCTVTGGKLLWLWIGNFLIIVPTIGLGMSWAMLRTLRFWTRHIQLVGEPELAAIRQDARATSALGESFADFLGFDFGF